MRVPCISRGGGAPVAEGGTLPQFIACVHAHATTNAANAFDRASETIKVEGPTLRGGRGGPTQTRDGVGMGLVPRGRYSGRRLLVCDWGRICRARVCQPSLPEWRNMQLHHVGPYNASRAHIYVHVHTWVCQWAVLLRLSGRL